MRQFASNEHKGSHGGQNHSLVPAAHANRKLPRPHKANASQPHNTKYNQCLSERFIGQFSEENFKIKYPPRAHGKIFSPNQSTSQQLEAT
jgi:hypothetical protein